MKQYRWQEYKLSQKTQLVTSWLASAPALSDYVGAREFITILIIIKARANILAVRILDNYSNKFKLPEISKYVFKTN